jgi:hypothetical protein
MSDNFDKNKELDIQRNQQEILYRQSRQQTDQKNMQDSWKIFQNEEGLTEAIKQQILPALVDIVRQDNVIGSGFIHESFLMVSNSHVLPTEEICQTSKFQTYDEKELNFESARFRENYSPDLTIAKVNLKNLQAMKTLKTKLPEDSDPNFTNQNEITFFVDKENFEPVFIEKKNPKEENVFPIIYLPRDQVSFPKPGYSGTPIIKGSVNSSQNWEFYQESVLYSLCKEGICSIPCNEDFYRNFWIDTSKTLASRYEEMISSCNIFQDSKKAEIKKLELDKILEEIQEMEKKYTNGEINFTINEIEEEMKLLGNEILEVSESFLIQKRMKKLSKSSEKWSVKQRNRRDEILKCYYNESHLLNKISIVIQLLCNQHLPELKKVSHQIDDFLTYGLKNPPEYEFRFDIIFNGDQHMVIQLQDNTPMGVTILGKSLSSVFAIVKIPSSCLEDVDGKILSKCFDESLKDRKEIIYPNKKDESEKVSKKKIKVFKK